MLSKEKYLKALDELVRYADIGRQRHGATSCDIDSYVSVREDLLCELISEHFNPSAYKFEELHEGMWVWDNQQKECIKINRLKNVIIHMNKYRHYIYRTYCDIPIEFEEDRFFPITKAYQEKEVDV